MTRDLRRGWVGRVLAATMILALLLPAPTQAWAQARENARAAEAAKREFLSPVSSDGASPSNALGEGLGAISSHADDTRDPRLSMQTVAASVVTGADEVLPVALLPRSVRRLSGGGAGADPWELFDGRATTASKLESSEPVRLTVELAEAKSLAAISVLGPTEGTLSVFAEMGPSARRIPLIAGVHAHAGANEWIRLPVENAAKASRLLVEWLPLSSAGPAEIRFWGRWQPTRDATDAALADRVLANAALGAFVARAQPDSVTAARVALGARPPEAGVVRFDLDTDPRSWARAFLAYELTGLGHFTQAIRQINGSTPRSGMPLARGDHERAIEGGLQVEEISPEWLRLGANEIRFLPLPEAGAPEYSVRRVRILGTSHSALAGARMADAKAGATSSTHRFAFDGAAKPHDLVFELLAPSKGRMLVRAPGAKDRAALDIDLHGFAAGWHRVSLDSLPNTTALDVSIDRAAGGGRMRREALGPDVSEVLVTTNPLSMADEAGEIAISYPLHGECRNREARVTGFVAARGDEVVGLRANGEDMTPALALDKSFALRLPEPSNKHKRPWTATLEATLASGKVVQRVLTLEPCIEDAALAREATVEDEGAPFAQLVRAGEAKTLTFGRVRLEIPAGAVDRDVRISVRPLVPDQVPAMSPRVTNVAPEGRAYRFGPHGLKFKKPVKITLPYDTAALEDGEAARDVFAFYYDEPLGSWQRIGRYDVARAGSLVSLTDHFTDFITGILAMPDAPGVKSFSSNEMKGIKLADPATGVALIAPPDPNSSGAMAVRYPIEVPPGRNGIEPTLAFAYSSAKPNGWMGVGWDLAISAVEIDTKFGVPRYDELNFGRDAYMIDGESIVPNATGSNSYVRRVEGSFDTIVRNVDANNCVTSWTVRDRNGKVSTYGGPGAVLAQPGNPCNAFRWGLSSVQDTFGNRMQVTYVTDSGTVPGGADQYVELYPERVDYTAHVTGATQDLAPAYRVLFVRDTANTRSDVMVSGRAGFQVRTRHRLDHVDVLLLGSPTTLIRRYQLAYEPPSLAHFYKSLLTSIGQQGLGAVMQLDQHTFEYGGAETIAVNGTQAGIRGFSSQVPWGNAHSGSALSRLEDVLAGGSGTLGIGLPIISLTATAGGNGGDETTRLAMLDLNGDGLPDLGSAGTGYMNYLRPELSVPAPGSGHFQPKGSSGLDSLGYTTKSGWSAGGGFSVVGIGPSASYSETSTHDEVVMTDIDGDGFVDRAWISGGKLRWAKNDGNNVFTDVSSNNNDLLPVSIDVNGDIRGGANSGTLVRINPLVRWKAPFAGTVTIQGAVQKRSAGGNGVDVAIFKNGQGVWSGTRGPSDLTPCTPSGTLASGNTDCSGSALQVSVVAGDALYFMTAPHHDPNGPMSQLGLEAVANEVSWNPTVSYDAKPASRLEPNGLPVYTFQQSGDFRLYRPEVRWVAPADGQVRVRSRQPWDASALPAKESTSDDVRIRVLKYPTALPSAIEFTVAADSTAPVAFTSAVIDVKKGDSIALEATSTSPIDFERLHFNPIITYEHFCRNVSTSDVPYCGAVQYAAGPPPQGTIVGDPELDSPISLDILSRPVQVSYLFPRFFGEMANALTVPSAQTVNVSGTLTFISVSSASATVLVQGINRLYSKQTVTFGPVPAVVSVTGPVDVPAGEQLMVVAYTDPDTLVAGSASAGGTTISNVLSRDATATDVNPDGTPVDPMSGGFHAWASGFYNGDLPAGFQPGNIVFPLTASGTPRHNPTRFFFGVPLRDDNGNESWSGPGGAYIAPGEFSATRGSALVGNSAGRLNSLRHATTWNFDLTAQVVVASFAVNQGRTRSDRDFFDFNGDRFPDAVATDGNVQYGNGQGGFKWSSSVSGVSELDSLRRVDHGSIRGGLSVGDVQLITDTATDGSVRKSVTTGFSVGTDYGLSTTNIDWVDVNGDGLPDAVQRNASNPGLNAAHPFTVRLNYGYRLGPATAWPATAWSASTANSATGVVGGLAKVGIDANDVTELINDLSFLGTTVGVNGVRLQDNGSNNVNIGGGVDVGGVEIGGGGGFSFGVTRTLVDMVDVNGDGLPDQVLRVKGDEVQGDPGTAYLRVRLNLGDRFDTNDTLVTVPKWSSSIDTGTDFAFSGDINDSLGFRRSKSFTSSFSIKVCFILCVGASGFHQSGSGWAHSNFEDLDGDGRADMVFKSKDSTAVYAKINQLPKELNLLKKVNRPLGGSFEVQYERAGNLVRRDLTPKLDDPGNKYVMTRLDVADGRGNHYVRSFSYDAAGYHDRLEREDYGFARVTTTRLRQNGTPYSSTEVNYNNQDFYRKGLVARSIVRDGAGNVFTVQNVTYAASGQGACTSPPGSVFPAELTRITGHFEGSTALTNIAPPAAICDANSTAWEVTGAVFTCQKRAWDCRGNLTDMLDKGDSGALNQVAYHVDYANPTLLGANIYKPSKVTAKDRFNKTLRERSATYDNRGALLALNEVVIGGQDPITGLPNTGHPATNPTWTYDYDTFGNLKKVIDPRGYTLDYLYDPTTRTHRTQVLDSFGYGSISVPDLRFGVVASETDLNLSITSYNYDDFGRLASVEGPYDVGTNHPTIAFGYSQVGVPVSSGLPASNPTPAYAITAHRNVQQPSQPIVTVSFADGLDRIIQTKKSLARDLGSGVEIGMAVSGPVVHDDQGRLIEQNQPYFDTSPAAVMAPLPASPVPLRKTDYDVLDRAVVIRTPLSTNPAGPDPYNYATATTAYAIGKINTSARLQATIADPNVNASTSGNPLPGYQRIELSGVRGNLLQLVEKNRLAGSSAPATLPTHYGYNALGELMAVTDAKGNVTRATYDTLGRIVTLISPDAGRTDFLFDLSGNLAAKQTGNLAQGFQHIRYEYEHNRLAVIDYPNSPDVTYEYGAWEESGPLGYYRASRIKQEVSEAGAKEYRYDPLGNVNEETWTLNRIGSPRTIDRTFAYDYDSFGRLLAVHYPGTSAEVVSYGYDAGGKLDTVTGVTASGITTNYVQHIGYDEFEQRTLITVGNGITTRYTQNPLTRLLQAVDASHRDPALVQAGAPARPFQQVRFQYDPVGNITQIANIAPFDPAQTGAVRVGPVTENFTYDDLYQLRTADGLHQTSANNRYHYGLSFAYDLISNVTSKAQVSETQTLSGSTVVQTTTRAGQTYASAFMYPTGGRPHAPTEVSDTLPGSSTPVKRAFTYDKNGNQSTWQRTTGTPANRQVTYSDDNRATSVTHNGVTLQEALYDGDGERLFKRANGSAYTAYFGQYLTVRSTVPSTKHIYAGDLRIASKFVPNDANEECASCADRPSVTYFHGDQLGSTTFATDEVQNLVAHEQYFPSGELWVDQTNDTPHTRQPYLFNGKELDVETGLYHYGARQYDPRLGLWTTPDPILSQYMLGAPNGGAYFPRNLALYTYGINNPIAVRDMDGRAWWTKVLKVGKAVYKGGDMAMAFADTIEDFNTVTDPNASVGDRLLAGASLLTEIAPVSVSDLKDVGRIIGVVDDVADARHRARQAETATAAAKASKTATPPCTGSSCGGPGVCFVAGTLVTTEQGQVPIEQLRLGDRVDAGNPECASDHLPPDARTIQLQIPNPYQPLDVIQLRVVRPLTWLSALGFDDGRAWVDLDEVGVSGWATVTGIGPAPEEQPGHGCLVLTTLEHVASEVLRLRLSGTQETLELTPTHQLYVEGSGWTTARELTPGVYLRTDSGPIAVSAIETAQPNQRVYNVEVGREHAYRVAEAGIWAHNACPEGGDRDLHAEAVAARDALSADLAKQKHPPATVAGAYSPSSGQATAQASRGGGRGCAEAVCAEALGNPPDIKFTPAVRPRTGQNVDVCPNCESTWGRGAFPDPKTKFKTDRGGE